MNSGNVSGIVFSILNKLVRGACVAMLGGALVIAALANTLPNLGCTLNELLRFGPAHAQASEVVLGRDATGATGSLVAAPNGAACAPHALANATSQPSDA